MTDRPEYFRYATGFGRVIAVYAGEEWEVDILPDSGGKITHALVVGPRLPERSTKQRPQIVLYGHGGATQGRTWALPIPSRLPGPRYSRKGLVYIEEVQGFRVVIKAPLNIGDVVVDQTGELEIHTTKGDRELAFRITEAQGVIETRTPKTSIVQNDDAGSITATCTGDATIHADGNVVVHAGKDIKADAAGEIDLTAPTIKMTGDVKIIGTLDVS